VRLFRLTDHEFSCEGPAKAGFQHNRGPAPILAVYHSCGGPAYADKPNHRQGAFVSCNSKLGRLLQARTG